MNRANYDLFKHRHARTRKTQVNIVSVRQSQELENQHSCFGIVPMVIGGSQIEEVNTEMCLLVYALA